MFNFEQFLVNDAISGMFPIPLTRTNRSRLFFRLPHFVSYLQFYKLTGIYLYYATLEQSVVVEREPVYILYSIYRKKILTCPYFLFIINGIWSYPFVIFFIFIRALTFMHMSYNRKSSVCINRSVLLWCWTFLHSNDQQSLDKIVLLNNVSLSYHFNLTTIKKV